MIAPRNVLFMPPTESFFNEIKERGLKEVRNIVFYKQGSRADVRGLSLVLTARDAENNVIVKTEFFLGYDSDKEEVEKNKTKFLEMINKQATAAGIAVKEGYWK